MSNVFSFTGTCGRDAEVRYLPSGQAVLNVPVANNIGFGDRQQTMWIRVALWGKRAEGQLQNYLKKGQQVFVSGELTMREYQGNDGGTKTSLELNANILDLVGRRSDNAGGGQSNQSSSGYRPDSDQQPRGSQASGSSGGNQPQGADSNGYYDSYDDDIPF